MTRLLHEEYILRIPITGLLIRNALLQRAKEVAKSTKDLQDPNISIVIRSRNNSDQLEKLLKDISYQDFKGKVEIILVDTGSTDNTKQVAKNFGAKIISITQDDFTYPDALNKGFAATSHKWVFTFADHSKLTSNQIFHIATRSEAEQNIAGVSGITLPNANATWSELSGSALFFSRRIHRKAHPEMTIRMGFLPANASLINRDVWQKVGGYNKKYAAGGEDTVLARSIIDAGYTIVVDPAMSVHHSHGVGLLNAVRQYQYWKSLKTPRAFNERKLAKFRKEYRSVKHL